MQDFSAGPGLKFRERSSAVIDVNTCHCAIVSSSFGMCIYKRVIVSNHWH